MTTIIIYQDYVHNNNALYKALCTRYGKDNIDFADADDILNGKLNNKIRAFLMPGGASRYVSAKLNGSGNRLIKEYVENGGTYIGICAGAYYGCQRIEWQPGFDQKFMVDNELGFFPGVAVGPVQQFVSTDNPHHIAAITSLTAEDGSQHKALYWAGPLFQSKETNYDVLARYTALPDQPAAIVSGTFGKGRYLLSSPHLEFDSAQLARMTFDVPDNRYADLAELPDTSGLTSDYFFSLLNRFID